MTVHGIKRISFEDYDGFVEKFKPKKTTDDCYTPDAVYEAVKDWAVDEYGLQGREIVRPFWPGGDYEMYDYPDGCVVIDNPPFSIITPIVRDYNAWGVDYLLFAPALTSFSIPAPCHIVTSVAITYENGADVQTSFVTNLQQDIARTSPNLDDALQRVKEEKAKRLPKYVYPGNLLTVNDLQKISRGRIDFSVEKGICVSTLDNFPKGKSGIFGKGFLISDERAELKRAELKRAELKRAELKASVIDLSEMERKLIEMMDGSS